jgi:hypothetical protein
LLLFGRETQPATISCHSPSSQSAEQWIQHRKNAGFLHINKSKSIKPKKTTMKISVNRKVSYPKDRHYFSSDRPYKYRDFLQYPTDIIFFNPVVVLTSQFHYPNKKLILFTEINIPSLSQVIKWHCRQSYAEMNNRRKMERMKRKKKRSIQNPNRKNKTSTWENFFVNFLSIVKFRIILCLKND